MKSSSLRFYLISILFLFILSLSFHLNFYFKIYDSFQFREQNFKILESFSFFRKNFEISLQGFLNTWVEGANMSTFLTNGILNYSYLNDISPTFWNLVNNSGNSINFHSFNSFDSFLSFTYLLSHLNFDNRSYVQMYLSGKEEYFCRNNATNISVLIGPSIGNMIFSFLSKILSESISNFSNSFWGYNNYICEIVHNYFPIQTGLNIESIVLAEREINLYNQYNTFILYIRYSSIPLCLIIVLSPIFISYYKIIHEFQDYFEVIGLLPVDSLKEAANPLAPSENTLFKVGWNQDSINYIKLLLPYSAIFTTILTSSLIFTFTFYLSSKSESIKNICIWYQLSQNRIPSLFQSLSYSTFYVILKYYNFSNWSNFTYFNIRDLKDINLLFEYSQRYLKHGSSYSIPTHGFNHEFDLLEFSKRCIDPFRNRSAIEYYDCLSTDQLSLTFMKYLRDLEIELVKPNINTSTEIRTSLFQMKLLSYFHILPMYEKSTNLLYKLYFNEIYFFKINLLL